MFQVGTNISPIIHTICKWMSCPLNCPFLFQFWYVISHHIYQLYFQSVNMSMFSALWTLLLCSSVQFSFSVVSDSSQPNRLQHTRPPCPLPTPGVYSNSCPLNWPSNHLILCHPLLLLPSIFPIIRVFSSESVRHIRWLKYWSFSFNISPSNEYSGLISFRMDWLDHLAVRGTLKSLLQHHSSKVSILLFLPSFNSVCTQWPQWISWVPIQMFKCLQMVSRSL